MKCIQWTALSFRAVFAMGLMPLFLVGLVAPGVSAKDITGKVVGVFYEPVVVNAKTFDKVSVTVSACPTGKFETVSFPVGSVSDDNSLGALFNHSVQSARHAVSKSQYMTSVGGHASFLTNDANVVQKSTFWGYNWECGQNLDQPGGGSNMPNRGNVPTTQDNSQGSATGGAPNGTAPKGKSGPGGSFLKNRLGL
ncbi:MAG: hypothetical protein K2X66_18030 [Cyanobacteria bacterium]|nr:hypothetical protein [Cyanobacteriota bacterium]